MPNLGFRSVTIASMPLRPGGENCAQVPENAMRDMSRNDVLVTVFFAGDVDAGPALPEILDDTTFPESSGNDAEECADRSTLETHWGGFRFGGESLYVLLAFGEDADLETKETGWNILRSLQSQGEAPDGGGRVCVVTLPGNPQLTPPDPYNPDPVDTNEAWYGTPALWTPLPIDGRYVPRKSVWWSSAFQGGAVEESPEINVTFKRLDVDEPPIEGERSTNAFTPEDGSFMIVGFDPNVPGCWEVTATYKGATLSYVYENH